MVSDVMRLKWTPLNAIGRIATCARKMVAKSTPFPVSDEGSRPESVF